MPNKQIEHRWLLYLYLVLLFFILTVKTYYFYSPKYPPYLYFYILRNFHASVYLPYYFNVIQLALNFIHLIPIILYINKQHFLSVRFWQVLFGLRIIFDAIGHPYEMNLVWSAFHTGLKPFFYVLAFMFSVFIPSYIICFKYAFAKK